MYSPTRASLDGSEATASAPSRPISFSQASRTNGLNRTKGFTMLDLLIVATIVSIVISYSLTEFVHAQTVALRHRATQELSSYLKQARSDSVRRHATDPRQMARVTILSDHSYSVAIDANGDGVIDAPVLVNLAEQRVVLGDSAPRAFIFDWLGRIVDAQQNVIPSARVTVSNNSGTSLINVSDITLSSATQNFAVSSSRK